MALRYVAKIHLGKGGIAQQEGDDIDALYAWMLAKSEGEFGHLHGEIIDNETGKSVRSLKSAPPD